VLERNVARAMASHWAWSDRAFYSENWDRRKRELKPKLVRWNPSWINEPEDEHFESAGLSMLTTENSRAKVVTFAVFLDETRSRWDEDESTRKVV
jgi:hypothetical protein